MKQYGIILLLLSGIFYIESYNNDFERVYYQECENKEVLKTDTCKALYRVWCCTKDCQIITENLNDAVKDLDGSNQNSGRIKYITFEAGIQRNSDSEIRNYTDRCIGAWAQEHPEIVLSKEIRREHINDTYSKDIYSFKIELLKPHYVDNEGNPIGGTPHHGHHWGRRSFEK